MCLFQILFMAKFEIKCYRALWKFVWVNFVLSLLTTEAVSFTNRLPSTEFTRHTVVRPTVHCGREKREIASTSLANGVHRDKLIVTVEIDGVDRILDLVLNKDLISADHVVRYQKDGQLVENKPSLQEMELCEYQGVIRGVPGSRAAVSTCDGITGVIYDGRSYLHIENSGEGIQGTHYIYDHGDLIATPDCGYKGGITTNSSYDPALHAEYHQKKMVERSRPNRYKRSSESDVFGPYNANNLSRYVELVLVIDNAGFRANDENLKQVHNQCKTIANIINSVYIPLNIFIALVGVVVWTENDEISLVDNGDTTLTNFLTYRREKLLRTLYNDNAQLLTRQKFEGGVVGKALKGPMCTYEFSGGVNTNHSDVVSLVATTVAHEMGHNFGMEHDNEEDCKCPDDKCIMSPSSTAKVPVHWSSCSLASLVLAFERGMDYCLRNKPRRLFESPTCGNGFVEAGEQCDCGPAGGPSAAGGNSVGGGGGTCAQCCHPDTCMLRDNATCAVGECCDLKTCKAKSAGVECRGAGQECDLPEYCTGHSSLCPDDVHKMDGLACDGDKAYCYQGSCRSHTDQCHLLWGPSGKRSHDKCYAMNDKGSKFGNCGYDRLSKQYTRCAPSDVQCGMLFCQHLNEQLEFGMESVANLVHHFVNINGTVMPCRAAMVDFGTDQVDPGLVPDGAKCDDNKMCVKQKCTSVLSVREAYSALPDSVCPSDCSKHGVCNSKGQCHCDVGFGPPLCAVPGHGGSPHSGPASDPSVQYRFMVAMYVIFLGIIPTILLLLFLSYYSRHNVLLWWKKPRKTSPSPKKTSIQKRISRSASKFAANFQNNPRPPPPAPSINVHSITSPDDMSSSLLRSDSTDNSSPNGNANPSSDFFGHFKGFSLVRMNKAQPKPAESDSKIGFEKFDQTVPITVNNMAKNAKITPVHRSGSSSQMHIPNQNKPARSAPPLPVVPQTAKPSSPKVELKRTNSSVQDRIKALIGNEKTENLSPVLSKPPRPTISSPILEASTCTAKELISPLEGSKTLRPVRQAPTVPDAEKPKRPLSIDSNVLLKPLPDEPKKVKDGISLNRIASFLRQERPTKERSPVERSQSLPKNANNQIKLPKASDKTALRNLQISGPILQKDIDLPVNTVPVLSDSEDGDDPKAFVARAQSMRGPTSQKAPIQSFGSMRQPSGTTRPISVAFTSRPTAPPPPRPDTLLKDLNSKNTSTYQNPKTENKAPDYIDCVTEKQAPLAHIDEESPDNIYAVIEEGPIKKLPPGISPPIRTTPQIPPDGYNTPKPLNSHSGSAESMGLLGEIVSEIQTRNLESIYSGSTLARKKKEKEEKNKLGQPDDSTYVNTEYKAPDSVYSNTYSGPKSSAASTTSSGYLHPSAVNVPNRLKTESFEPKEEPRLTSDTDSTPASPKGASSKIPTFTRQVTPPGFKTTSTFRNVPSSPKNVPKSNITKVLSNSPDLVSSCLPNDTKNVRAPDLVNNNISKPTLGSNISNKLNNKLITTKEDKPPLRPAITEKKINIVKPTPLLKNSINPSVNKQIDKSDIKPSSNVTAKVDSNVKNLADSINKNKPKIVPKPAAVNVQRSDSIVSKPNATKPATRSISNVANLQKKFEAKKLSDKK